MTEKTIKNIGFQIKSKRKENRISQKDFANELGISNFYLCKIEKGKLCNYSIDLLIKICQKLNIVELSFTN